MKNIIITQSQLKKELVIYSAFLAVAFIMNLYAIIAYDGLWQELITQLHIVFALSVFFYLIVALVRAVVTYIKFLVGKKGAITVDS